MFQSFHIFVLLRTCLGSPANLLNFHQRKVENLVPRFSCFSLDFAHSAFEILSNFHINYCQHVLKYKDVTSSHSLIWALQSIIDCSTISDWSRECQVLVNISEIFIWWMAAGFHVESELQTFEVFWGFLSVDYNQITMIQTYSFRTKNNCELVFQNSLAGWIPHLCASIVDWFNKALAPRPTQGHSTVCKHQNQILWNILFKYRLFDVMSCSIVGARLSNMTPITPARPTRNSTCFWFIPN